jgi:peptidoglycan/LPS O-acetylase OafA/YrhL
LSVRSVILSLVITFVLGIAAYELLESPFLRLKRRFTWVPARGLNDLGRGTGCQTLGI